MFKNIKLRTKFIGMIICLLLLTSVCMMIAGLTTLSDSINAQKSAQSPDQIEPALAE